MPLPPGYPASARSRRAWAASRSTRALARVAPAVGRRERMGRRVAAREDPPRDDVPVDREREGAPHPRVVEGRPRDVEPQEERLEERVDPQPLRRVAPVGRRSWRREASRSRGAGPPGSPSPRRPGLSVGKKTICCSVTTCGVPVVGVPGDDDARVGHPLLERERPVADEVARAASTRFRGLPSPRNARGPWGSRDTRGAGRPGSAGTASALRARSAPSSGPARRCPSARASEIVPWLKASAFRIG